VVECEDVVRLAEGLERLLPAGAQLEGALGEEGEVLEAVAGELRGELAEMRRPVDRRGAGRG
jgi:hypothetical protein